MRQITALFTLIALLLVSCSGAQTPLSETIEQIVPTDTSASQADECHYGEHKDLYQGLALLVVQVASEIVVENISGRPIAIRVSWDGVDPSGIGRCPDFPDDCFIDDWVEPKRCVKGKIKNYTSVQVWAWGTSGELIDSCNLPLEPEPVASSIVPLRAADTPTTVLTAPINAVAQVLVPLYSYPNWYDKASYIWDDIALANSRIQIAAVINPSNGPGGSPPNSDYQHGLNELRQAGITILGYVHTSYGARDLDTVKAEIDLYYQHFDIGGIFFDEVADSDDMCSYYKDLYNFARSLPDMDMVVINPGTSPTECYFSQPTCDTGVIFEGYSSDWAEYQLPSYVYNYSSERFAVLVHTVPDIDTMQSHIDLAQNRNIGYMYLTNDTLDNPWDTLPSFWLAEIDRLSSSHAGPAGN